MRLTLSPLVAKGVDVILDDLSLLGDTTRVRILRLIEREELGVGELVDILQVPQSTISRHLKALTTANWIQKHTVATSSLVRLDTTTLGEARSALWALVRDQTAEDATTTQDLQRMASILAQRQLDSRAFFDAVGSRWGEVRRELFGDQFTVSTLAAMLEPNLVVADLGCGTGEATAALATAVQRVIAVDHEQAMLDATGTRIGDRANVEMRLGELTALPIADQEVDCALIMLVLHHVHDVAGALREVRRVLRPGGRLILLDMTRHNREAYRHRMGHVHLGFDREALDGLATEAGLTPARYHLVPADPDAQGPGLFVATYHA